MITDILILVWMHFILDFIVQTRKEAENKSKSIRHLGMHVLKYSVPFVFFGIWFAMVTFILHFITDFISSRITSYAHRNDKNALFWNTIGIDQAVHITCLIMTYVYFY